MSNAVDQAIEQIDFSPLQGRKVYLETKYLDSIKGFGIVNAGYITSSLRQQLASVRCLIQDKREQADIIVEPRVGALGTDGHEVTYGIPQTSALSTATAAITSTPLMPAIPEISFGKQDAHSGVAKIIVFAFERETKHPVWQSGVAQAESDCNHTWFLGIGPFQRGSIHDDVRFAGKRLTRHEENTQPSAPTLSYAFEHVFQTKRPTDDGIDVIPSTTENEKNIQQASHEEAEN